MLPYADFVNEHLPWVNSKRAHSVTGSPFRAPTFNPLEIDSGGFPGTMPEFELPGRGTPEPAPTGHNFFDNMTPDSEPAFTVLGAAARSLWGGGEYSRTAASRAAQASSSQAPSGAARAAPPPEATDAAVPGAGASPAAQPDSASTTAVSSTPQTESTSAPLNRNQRRRLAQEQQKAQQQQRQQPALAQATSRAQPDEQQPISSAQLSARFSQQQAEGRAAPSGQGLKRATLLPEDEATLVETMSGMPVPTTYYSLPFTASDGRQALLAVAGDLVPWVSPREVRSPNAGRRPPGWTGQSGEKEPWVPTAPYFVPANASPDNIPWLWDDVGHFVSAPLFQHSRP